MLIGYHDEISHRLSHLQPISGFDPKKAELDILGYSCIATDIFGSLQSTHPRVAVERAARFQKLLRHCAQNGSNNPAGTWPNIITDLALYLLLCGDYEMTVVSARF